MSLPVVTSREQWLAARKQLLAKEKELTRLQDALNTSRRQLPMVRVEVAYTFTGPAGQSSLTDLFSASSQLIVQHVMFDPAWDDACPSCTACLDELSAGLLDIFHTYSTFGRGAERNSGTYSLLDITALGRQEEWEEPKGRADAPREDVPDFAE